MIVNDRTMNTLMLNIVSIPYRLYVLWVWLYVISLLFVVSAQTNIVVIHYGLVSSQYK